VSEFQALITGSIAGALMRASAEDGFLLIDVDVPRDSQGDYLNEIVVVGRESGEQLRITVAPLYDTPESVAEKMQDARAVMDAAQRHLG